MKKILASFCLLAALSFPNLAFAGGGLISWLPTTTSSEDYNNFRISSLSPGEQFVVRPQVHLPNDDPYDTTTRYCSNCPIKIKLENPQNTDIINQSSDVTDENGTIYAKIISKIPGKRYVYAEVTLSDSKFVRENGNFYRSSVLVLNYGGESQWEPPTVTPLPVPNNMPGPISVSSPVAKPAQVMEIYPQNSSEVTVTSIASVSDSAESENLNKKVADLEKQLEESQKRQSILEEKISQLVSFLKSIFPFFK